ncbi:MAG: SPOR domain-containing protein [Bacteroidia bacterium]|jgi:cell division septation protein DedD|nr:SPOR domain-containing protein [Bacteroidia bacterium]
MYQMWAVRGQADGYGVQIGAFGSYYRMLDVLNELGQQEVINTLVHSDIKNDKPVFRIIVGPFPTRPEAEAARKKLQALKMNGIVVELASLPQ